jgi:hypothetical protein
MTSDSLPSFWEAYVRHSDFQIGTHFFTETGKWRCTDVGTRVIVAISLEPHEMVRSQEGADGRRIEEHFISDDPRDLEGPPYMVAEHVFDEYSIEGCYASEDEVSGSGSNNSLP